MTALGEEPPKEPMSLRLCNLYVSQREREREREREEERERREKGGRVGWIQKLGGLEVHSTPDVVVRISTPSTCNVIV